MIDIENFFIELVDSKHFPIKHICLWFQLGIYAVRVEFTLTGIRFAYMIDDIKNYNVKTIKKNNGKLRIRLVFDCVSMAKSVLCKGKYSSPTKFYERIK